MNPSTLSLFKSTPGAMSVAEGTALSRLAASAPPGTCVECGTFAGKSAIAIAAGLRHARLLHLIDNDFKAAYPELLRLVNDASDGRVNANQLPGTSFEWLPILGRDTDGGFAFVFLDTGDHSYELCKGECDIVVPHMVPGGLLVFHDFRSQFIGVEKAYDEVLAAGGFEEVIIPWDEIAVETRHGALEEGNNSFHHEELRSPQFLGALRKK